MPSFYPPCFQSQTISTIDSSLYPSNRFASTTTAAADELGINHNPVYQQVHSLIHQTTDRDHPIKGCTSRPPLPLHIPYRCEREVLTNISLNLIITVPESNFQLGIVQCHNNRQSPFRSTVIKSETVVPRVCK